MTVDLHCCDCLDHSRGQPENSIDGGALAKQVMDIRALASRGMRSKAIADALGLEFFKWKSVA